MASALSVDLRERVVAAIEAGASRREAARRFEVTRPAPCAGTGPSCRRVGHTPSRWAAINARTPSRHRLT